MFSEDQIPVRVVYMRGGSSKGAYLLESDLPKDPELRDRFLLALYGSPDERQIDGLGGADPLTSKAAIVGRSSRSDADVNYTFAQVGIQRAKVYYGGNCGNMLSGVGPFAIDQGLVPAIEPITEVRIYNTNTDSVIVAEVPVKNGKARVLGDCAIAGVPGTGARIMLNFLNAAGSVTKKLLPTGNPVDTFDLDGRKVQMSIVDAATPFVFILPETVGMRGTELPAEMTPEILARLEKVRGLAARVIGLAKEGEVPVEVTPNIPRVSVVSPPVSYASSTGEMIEAGEVDLLARQLSMQRPHKAYAVTGSVCTAVAAKIPGTIVNEVCRSRDQKVRIGHPSGVLPVEAEAEEAEGGFAIRRAAISRTARRIMDGVAYLPRTVLDEGVPR